MMQITILLNLKKFGDNHSAYTMAKSIAEYQTGQQAPEAKLSPDELSSIRCDSMVTTNQPLQCWIAALQTVGPNIQWRQYF